MIERRSRIGNGKKIGPSLRLLLLWLGGFVLIPSLWYNAFIHNAATRTATILGSVDMSRADSGSGSRGNYSSVSPSSAWKIVDSVHTVDGSTGQCRARVNLNVSSLKGPIHFYNVADGGADGGGADGGGGGAAAPIAVIVTGLVRNLRTVGVAAILSSFEALIKDNKVDFFLNIAGIEDDSWELESIVSHLGASLKAYTVDDMDIGWINGGNSSDSLCMGFRGACTSADGGRDVGCYRGNGQECHGCDTRKYWRQFGRIYLTLTDMVFRYEAMRKQPYEWIVRVRSDVVMLPEYFGEWRRPDGQDWRSLMQKKTIYFCNFQHHLGYGNGILGGAYDDRFFVVHRSLSEAFFSVAFAHLECQWKNINGPLCSGADYFNWATPECVLSVHFLECVEKRFGGIEHHFWLPFRKKKTSRSVWDTIVGSLLSLVRR